VRYRTAAQFARLATAALAVWFSAGAARAGVSAAETARLLAQNGFDADACYRIHNIDLTEEDLRIYLTSGYLMLSKKVAGTRPAALFSADVEAGDAEMLLMPPNRSERLSLASFTDSPNFDAHFQTAVMLLSADTVARLERTITDKEAEAGMSLRDAERGSELAAKWTPILQKIQLPFETRIVQNVLSPGSGEFFFATVAGKHLGDFDVEYDALPSARILLGQGKERGGRTWFDTWCSFAARSARQRKTAAPQAAVMSDMRMEATLDQKLSATAVTRAKVVITAGNETAVPFLIAGGMRVTEAKIDGQPAEVFQARSGGGAIRGGDDVTFLVVPAAPLQPGRSYEFEFHYKGDVISPAGNDVFFVGARGSWYPHEEMEFSNFDITYRWPKTLQLVSTGDLVESRTEGDQNVARFRTAEPIRLAGFNLGKYVSRELDRGGFHVEVCANAAVEPALQAKQSPPRLDAVADEVAAALAFMTERFGPPPVKSVTVSPIPGRFGQGFPGLIYLSTMTYLQKADRPAALRDDYLDLVFSDLLAAHETAHQWWGNLVPPQSLEDDWLPEALANYSALLFLEKTRGPKVVESVLDAYRRDLTANSPGQRTVESAGPITWGTRLSTPESPDAWRVITYEKGSWIMHMLRRRLGDENFIAFLRELCVEYRFRGLSTDDFRATAAKFLPAGSPDSHLESFFDTWAYGTGIPRLKLAYTIKGLRISGSISQSGVAEDFSAWVPVEVAAANGKTNTYWVETGSEPATFSWTLRQKPLRAALRGSDALMTIQE